MTKGRSGKQTLSGRAAIVTGSTSGIGLAIARALAGSGANVVLNGFGALKLSRPSLSKNGTRS
jgi:NAD(P)-dependent dehydrogenase (short-subunit alcohol dehydrogenase family)